MSDDCVILTHNVRRFSRYEGYLDSFRFAGGWPKNILQEREGDYFGLSAHQQSIVTMDAVFSRHFDPDSVERDVAKAFTAFFATAAHHLGRLHREGVLPANAAPARGAEESAIQNHIIELRLPLDHEDQQVLKIDRRELPITISTGRWGCGAFGGDVLHKFVQQWVAAKRVNEKICSLGSLQGRPPVFLQLQFSSFRDTDTLAQLQAIVAALEGSGVCAATIYRLLRMEGSRDVFLGGAQSVVRRIRELRGGGEPGERGVEEHSGRGSLEEAGGDSFGDIV